MDLAISAVALTRVHATTTQVRWKTMGLVFTLPTWGHVTVPEVLKMRWGFVEEPVKKTSTKTAYVMSTMIVWVLWTLVACAMGQGRFTNVDAQTWTKERATVLERLVAL